MAMFILASRRFFHKNNLSRNTFYFMQQLFVTPNNLILFLGVRTRIFAFQLYNVAKQVVRFLFTVLL